jgi:site-specific recombinase XerC
MKVSSVDFDQGAVIVDGKGSKQRALSIIDAGNPKGGLTLKLVANWIEVRRHAARHRAAHHAVDLDARPTAVAGHAARPWCSPGCAVTLDLRATGRRTAFGG